MEIQKFRQRSGVMSAVRWSGGPDEAAEIIEWVRARKGEATYHPAESTGTVRATRSAAATDLIVLTSGHSSSAIGPGGWITHDLKAATLFTAYRDDSLLYAVYTPILTPPRPRPSLLVESHQGRLVGVSPVLSAHLDEDERLAREACHRGEGRWHQPDAYESRVTDDQGHVVIFDNGQAPTLEETGHITRHDPARVLDDVAAKRKILELLDTTTDTRLSAEAWVVMKKVVEYLTEPYEVKVVKVVKTPWKCSRCGSNRWVAASVTGPVSHGGRAIKQCIPCGHYSNDKVDPDA